MTKCNIFYINCNNWVLLYINKYAYIRLLPSKISYLYINLYVIVCIKKVKFLLKCCIFTTALFAISGF